MPLLTLLGISFGLSMDAFSVAIASGIALGVVSHRQAFRLSFHFGLFQFGMPIIGWLTGSLIAAQMGGVDDWIAFGLLTLVGGKMVWEALTGDEDAVRGDPTRGFSLIMLSFATSLDALAVGLSLAMIRVPVLFPSTVIGAVAGGMTLLGLQIGKRAGDLLGRRMEVLGGLVLLAIAVRILLEHFGI